MKKKVLSVLLTLCLVGGLMACGNGNSSSNTSSASTDTATESEEESTEEIDPDALMDEKCYTCESVEILEEGDIILDNENVTIRFGGLEPKEECYVDEAFRLNIVVENKTDDLYCAAYTNGGGIGDYMFDCDPSYMGETEVKPGKKSIIRYSIENDSVPNMKELLDDGFDGIMEAGIFLNIEVRFGTDINSDNPGNHTPDYAVEFKTTI